VFFNCHPLKSLPRSSPLLESVSHTREDLVATRHPPRQGSVRDTCYKLHRKLEEVKRLEDRVADIYPEMHRCCQRLQHAEAVDRVESQRGEEIHLISPWTFERGRST
jgi:hypothetical protein